MTTKTIQTERKPLEFYLALKYPVTITPDITGGYVAEIQDLPVALHRERHWRKLTQIWKKPVIYG